MLGSQASLGIQEEAALGQTVGMGRTGEFHGGRNTESRLIAKRHPDKMMRPALTEAVDLGHTVRQTRNGHYQVLHSSGEGMVTLAGTASDHRARKNATSMMKRQGLCVKC